ncbi:MAG TPA: hypothetical protein EYG73_11965 [Arcobacter sp.]|nr:hypothetical protein [Arcobacter sp.]
MNLRNINLFKQLKLSFGYKVGTIIVSFFLLKFMIEYLGVVNYGIWSIILSFITWVLFFDFGIANGVKNKVAESLSLNNNEAPLYISTGYMILSLFVLIVYILFYFISYYINWQIFFNTNSFSNIDLQNLMLISLFFILLNFVLSIVNAVFNASQNASLIVLNQFLSQTIALIILYLLIIYSDTNIYYIAVSYGSSLVLSNIVVSIWFYRNNRILSPSIKYIDRKKIKEILALGLNFFVLQITILIIINSDKIIITQLLGLECIASYDILYKYFSILLIIHGVVNTPLWSIYTEAYSKNDYNWIESTLLKMIKLMFLYAGIAYFMYIFGAEIITLWINEEISRRLTISNYIYMSVMILFFIWYTIFAYFTNGIGKTNIQLVSSVLGAVINIPLSIYFVKYIDMGLNGILLATIISLSIFGILGPIQAINELKLMKKKN